MWLTFDLCDYKINSKTLTSKGGQMARKPKVAVVKAHKAKAPKADASNPPNAVAANSKVQAHRPAAAPKLKAAAKPAAAKPKAAAKPAAAKPKAAAKPAAAKPKAAAKPAAAKPKAAAKPAAKPKVAAKPVAALAKPTAASARTHYSHNESAQLMKQLAQLIAKDPEEAKVFGKKTGVYTNSGDLTAAYR